MKPRAASSICFVICAGCLTAADDPSVSTEESAIIDNSLAGPRDLLGVVFVDSIYKCTGELVSSNTVLTAAHCVCEGTSCAADATVSFRLEPSTTGRMDPITGRVRAHPGYGGNHAFDLATITFDSSAPGYASPFTVSSTLPSAGAEIMIAGYGDWGPDCANEHSPYPQLHWDNTHFDRMAAYPTGPTMMQWDDEVWCDGDSGGAALESANQGLNPTVLTGIISGWTWSFPYGRVALATATAHFYGWIKDAVCPSTAQNRCTGNGTLCDCTSSTSLLWQNRTTGDLAIWTMDGGRATSTPTVQQAIPLGWKIAGSGDFDGDRQADILWRYRDSTTTYTAIWRMVGTTHVSDSYPADLGRAWDVKAVADFDANGRADILWGNTSTGEHRLWKNGDPTSTRQKVSYQNSGANVPTTWFVRGAGDFNGDGKADIFWEKNDGSTAIWLMDGSAFVGEQSFGSRELGFAFKGIGDFNGDARADILWGDGDGYLRIWFNGGGVSGASGPRDTKLDGPSWNNQYVTIPGTPPGRRPKVRPAPVSTSWYVDRIADFNHDGRDDLLWRSGSPTSPGTQMAIWYLDGTRFVGETDPRMPGESGPHWFDPAWQTTGVSRQPNF